MAASNILLLAGKQVQVQIPINEKMLNIRFDYWSTPTENHFGDHSGQLGTWNLRVEWELSGESQVLLWFEGQNLALTAWNHWPNLTCCNSSGCCCWWGYNGMGNIWQMLGPRIPIKVYLNATTYLKMIADHAHPFTSTTTSMIMCHITMHKPSLNSSMIVTMSSVHSGLLRQQIGVH